MSSRINRAYDPDIIRREAHYDRHLGAGTSQLLGIGRNIPRYYRAAKRLIGIGAAAYGAYKKYTLPPSTNKSGGNKRVSFSMETRGRKRNRSRSIPPTPGMVRRRRMNTVSRSRSRVPAGMAHRYAGNRYLGLLPVAANGGRRNRRPSRRRSIRRRSRFRRRTFKGRKTKKMNMRPSKHGASLVVERSGVITGESAHAVYVGHGVSTEQFWANVCRAIVRKLFRILGQEITDWNHNVYATLSTTPLILDIGYSVAQNPTSILVDSTNLVIPALPSTLSYGAVSDTLFARFLALFTPADSNIVFYHISLRENTALGTTNAKLDMSNVTVQYKVTSKLKLQNASLAGTTTTDIEDEDSGNVTANPLVGKLYYKKTRANGFKLQTAPINGINTWAAVVGTIANRGTGMINWVSSSAFVPDFQLKFKKPPMGHMFQAQSKPYGMDPGQIKTLTWTDVRKIKFHKLIEIGKVSFTDNAGDGYYQNIGKIQMVGLEKKMHCLSNESNIVLHWALEQHYSCVISKTLGVVPRIQQIVDP